jgi:hypothetical protein
VKAPECELSDTEIYLRQAVEALNQIIGLRNRRILVLEGQLKEKEKEIERLNRQARN